MKHIWILVVLSLVTIAAHASGLQAYFCGTDDYVERNRAAFVDGPDPLTIITTSHLGTMKYRPLNRAVTYLTYQFEGNDATWYRVRNLFFHVSNVLLVYAVGCLLLGSPGVALAGALLFGTHPLTHQTIAGAVWTNTTAYTTFLGSLSLFLTAIRGGRHWKWRVAGAAFLILLGILLYEPVITVVGVMAGCLLLYRFGREKPPHFWSLIRVSLFAVVVVVLLQVGLRTVLVPGTFERADASRPTVPRVAANLVIFSVALMLPDSVLANSWFGTPLPSDLNLEGSYTLVIVAALAGAVVLLIASAFLRRLLRSKAHPPHGPPFDWRKLLLLAVAIPICLVPQLVLTGHPSETYLYMPVAFFALLLSYAAAYVTRPRDGVIASPGSRVYWGLVAGLCALGICAIQARSQLIVECGELVQRLEANFSRELADPGVSHIVVAPAPIPIPTPFGLYRLQGIETIGRSSRFLTRALQLIAQDEGLKAELVKPEDLAATCRQQEQSDMACFQVFPDGRVERYFGERTSHAALAPVAPARFAPAFAEFAKIRRPCSTTESPAGIRRPALAKEEYS